MEKETIVVINSINPSSMLPPKETNGRVNANIRRYNTIMKFINGQTQNITVPITASSVGRDSIEFDVMEENGQTSVGNSIPIDKCILCEASTNEKIKKSQNVGIEFTYDGTDAGNGKICTTVFVPKKHRKKYRNAWNEYIFA